MGGRSETGTQRDFTVVVERDEDGNYVASVPALAGCHTQARLLDELMRRVQEVVALCLEDADAAAVPSLEFIGVQRITVSA